MLCSAAVPRHMVLSSKGAQLTTIQAVRAAMLPQSVQADVAGVLIWYSCLILTPCVHDSCFLKLGKHPQTFWAALDTSAAKAARSKVDCD